MAYSWVEGWYLVAVCKSEHVQSARKTKSLDILTLVSYGGTPTIWPHGHVLWPMECPYVLSSVACPGSYGMPHVLWDVLCPMACPVSCGMSCLL